MKYYVAAMKWKEAVLLPHPIIDVSNQRMIPRNGGEWRREAHNSQGKAGVATRLLLLVDRWACY
jgi:hypothetical protein